MSGSILPNQGRLNETNPFYIPYADVNYFASSFTINTGGGISLYNISTPVLRITSNATPTIILSPSQNGSAVQSCYVSSFGNITPAPGNISNGYITIAPTNTSAFNGSQNYPYKYTILNQ